MLQSEKKTDKQNSSKNEELIKRKEVKNTPFMVITTKDGSFGVIGEYRLTKLHKTIKEAEKDVQKMTWGRLIQVISIVAERTKQISEK